MSAALGLLRLQQVDSRLGHVNSRLNSIQAALDNNAELAEAGEILSRRQGEFDAIERARQSQEHEVQFQRTKILEAESSLYGGGVRNPKELQDLQADVVSLKKHLVTLEERELESMMQLETADSALLDSRQQLARVQARIEESRGKLIEEQEQLGRDRDNLETERQAAQAAISPRFLTTYEELRLSRRGVAVAEVTENACSACGTTLTAALQQSARHATELVHCPSCGRILYAG